MTIPCRLTRFGKMAAIVLIAVTTSVQACQVLFNAHPESTAASIVEKLNLLNRCKRIEAAGFTCMCGIGSLRYSVTASSFDVGSVSLPQSLMTQLNDLAEVLRIKNQYRFPVRIVVSADATGQSEANLALAVRRAESIRNYLISKEIDAGLLFIEDKGVTE